MDKNIDILHEAKRLRLLAAALELQHYTSAESNIVPIPGGDHVIAIGTPAQVRALLAHDASVSDGTASAGARQPLADERALYDHWWHEGPHPFRDISKRKNCQLNEETAWMVWQAACAALAQQAGAHADLVVGTAVSSHGVAVAVHLKRGDHTTVLYSRNHSAKGDSLGVERVPANVLAAPSPSAQEERDAKRYRFVRALADVLMFDAAIAGHKPEAFDAAIDAAMSQAKTQEAAGQKGGA